MIALGACGSLKEARDIEGNIVSPGNFRAGSGVIESVGVLPNAHPPQPGPMGAPPSRAADPNLYRLYVRMDNAGYQAVDVDDGTFMAGEAVELTNDGRVVRITGTDLLRALRKKD